MTDPHEIRAAIGGLLQTPDQRVVVEATVSADSMVGGATVTRYVITAEVHHSLKKKETS